MTDDTDSAIEFNEFREWLEETAAREDQDTESILQRLISTYWIVQELSETMQEDSLSDVSIPESDDEETNETPDLAELVGELSELRPRPANMERSSSSGIDPTLLSLIELLQSNSRQSHTPMDSHTRSDSSAWPALAETRERLASLERSVDDLERLVNQVAESADGEELAALQERCDRMDEDVASQLEAMDATIDAVYADLSDYMDDVLDQVSDNETHIEDLEEETADLSQDLSHEREERERVVSGLRNELSNHRRNLNALMDTLEDLGTEFETHAHEVSDRFDETTESFQETIAEIESHLDHLYNDIDDLDHRQTTLVDTLDTRLADLINAHEAQGELMRLRRLATQNGVTSAKCEYCKTGVDLRMLDEPLCPQCDRRFDDLEVEEGFLRSKGILRTSDSLDPLEGPSLRNTYQAAIEDTSAEDD